MQVWHMKMSRKRATSNRKTVKQTKSQSFRMSAKLIHQFISVDVARWDRERSRLRATFSSMENSPRCKKNWMRTRKLVKMSCDHFVPSRLAIDSCHSIIYCSAYAAPLLGRGLCRRIVDRRHRVHASWLFYQVSMHCDRRWMLLIAHITSVQLIFSRSSTFYSQLDMTGELLAEAKRNFVHIVIFLLSVALFFSRLIKFFKWHSTA